MHLNDQITAMLPNILKILKPTIVQGRAEVAFEYDALVPRFIQAFQGRMSEFSDAIAVVYAKNFSADDLRTMTEFYKTPTGQRVLQKLPSVSQESSIVGQNSANPLVKRSTSRWSTNCARKVWISDLPELNCTGASRAS